MWCEFQFSHYQLLRVCYYLLIFILYWWYCRFIHRWRNCCKCNDMLLYSYECGYLFKVLSTIEIWIYIHTIWKILTEKPMKITMLQMKILSIGLSIATNHEWNSSKLYSMYWNSSECNQMIIYVANPSMDTVQTRQFIRYISPLSCIFSLSHIKWDSLFLFIVQIW